VKSPTLVLACLLALPCASRALPGPQAAGKPDLSTPEKAVHSFVVALDEWRLAAAAACVVGEDDVPMLDSMEPELGRVMKDPLALSIKDVKSVITGSEATVTCTVQLTTPGVNRSFQDTVPLRRVGGQWLIVPFTPEEAVGIKNVHGRFLRLASTPMGYPEELVKSRDALRADICASNVRHLATGVMILTQDHDTRIALRADRLREGLTPHVKDLGAFQCPSRPKEPISYTLNPDLQDVSTSSLRHPALTVLLYEGSNGVLEYRHYGKTVVAFADGSVKQLTPDQTKNLRWKP
jgi:prepilin-type processing-associated H-X9-DG protein